MSRTTHEELQSLLSDLYSVELQALAQLENAPGMTEVPAFREYLEQHLAETHVHAEVMRERLEALGGSSSSVKNAIMKMGGKGFVLFARVQSETSGRLLVHAYAYEAMEWAGYAVLAHVADIAEDASTADLARSVQVQERDMMERLEGCFDAVESEAHSDVPAEKIGHHVCQHLAEAHALEKQSLTLQKRAAKTIRDPALAAIFASHIAETRMQLRELEMRLSQLGGDTSLIEDAVMVLGGINWTTFFVSQQDTPAKLTVFAYAFEHLEIGAYEMLLRTARRAGDAVTAQLVTKHLEEERCMARRLTRSLEPASALTLAAVSP